MDIVKQVLDKVLGSPNPSGVSRKPVFVGTRSIQQIYDNGILYSGIIVSDDLIVPYLKYGDSFGAIEVVEDQDIGRIISSSEFWDTPYYAMRYEMLKPMLELHFGDEVPTKIQFENYKRKVIYEYGYGVIKEWRHRKTCVRYGS